MVFPPQAVSEGKAEHASIQGGLQGERSTVRFNLPVSAKVPLDVAGFLELLATLDIPAADTIKESGIPSTVARKVSALGGTLVSDALEWDHVTALGRDQRVRFQQRGILYPFGHPAVLT